MKSNLRVVSLLALLGAGAVLAQATKSAAPAPTHEQMEKAKAAMMEDRKQMMSEAKTVDSDASAIMSSVKGMQGEQVKALEAQVAKLQADIKVLTTHLSQTPRYFDTAESKLRP
jgi:peptidoglycan hydrolase CwlO-like protein